MATYELHDRLLANRQAWHKLAHEPANNTAGLHRGGFATGRPRVLATFTYDSPAALKALSERNFVFAGANGTMLDGVVRYALE